MRLTTTRLRQLIREELTRSLQEQVVLPSRAEFLESLKGYFPLGERLESLTMSAVRTEVEDRILDELGLARALDLGPHKHLLPQISGKLFQIEADLFPEFDAVITQAAVNAMLVAIDNIIERGVAKLKQATGRR
jgi:hypothetical protein